jgi:diguanylate cyclase (GGDEF)-like protein
LTITVGFGVSLIVLSAFGVRFFFLLAKNTADRQARRLRRLLALSWSGLVLVELHGMLFDVFTAIGIKPIFSWWSTEYNLLWDVILLAENVVNLLLLREFQRGGLDCLVGVFQRVDELKKAASLDSLTGLFNRMVLTRIKDHFTWQCAAVLMIDIDDFKRFNDTHGHVFGDQILRLVSQAVRGAVREGDLAFRYGGEELLVVCPDAPLDRGIAAGERIRQSLTELPIQVTVSIGVASCVSPQRFDAAVVEADEAMYAAKQQGKNRVVAAMTGEEIA